MLQLWLMPQLQEDSEDFILQQAIFPFWRPCSSQC
jgi:hypothetical protein